MFGTADLLSAHRPGGAVSGRGMTVSGALVESGCSTDVGGHAMVFSVRTEALVFLAASRNSSCLPRLAFSPLKCQPVIGATAWGAERQISSCAAVAGVVYGLCADRSVGVGKLSLDGVVQIRACDRVGRRSAGGSQQASHWLHRQPRGYWRRFGFHACTQDCISSTWPEGCGSCSDGSQVAGRPSPKSPINLLPGEREGSEGCAMVLPPAVVSGGPQQPLHPPRHGKPRPSWREGDRDRHSGCRAVCRNRRDDLRPPTGGTAREL